MFFDTVKLKKTIILTNFIKYVRNAIFFSHFVLKPLICVRIASFKARQDINEYTSNVHSLRNYWIANAAL